MIRTAPLALLALAALLAGCDALDAQAEFREAAALPPSGIHATDANGTATGQTDPDDWRTAPVYAGRFLVTRRAFPNPVSPTGTVTFEGRVTGFNVVPGGLRLVGFTETGRRVVLQERPEATSDGIYSFSFFGTDLVDAEPTGLRRVILFDGRSEVVTYGDIQVTP